MSLWLKADAGVLNASGVACADGEAIATWQDQSGNIHHAVQATAINRPTLHAAAIRSKPIVHCTAPQWLTVAVNFPSPCSVFLVARVISGGNGRVLGGNSNNWLLGFWQIYQDQCYAEGAVRLTSAPPADATLHLFDAVLTGSLTSFWDNQTLVASNANGVTGPNGLVVGGDNQYFEYSNSETAEVIVYPSALSDTDRQTTENYLLSKWINPPTAKPWLYIQPPQVA